MGKADKSDALIYNNTASSIRYYQVSSSGSYAPLDGLSATLTTIALT